MINTLTIGIVVFAVIFSSALAGMKLSEYLPAHHLKNDTKDLVNVSTAVIATISALVLGLLISNANTNFSRIGGEVTTLSASILRLDHILEEYGADAEPARKMLLRFAEQKSVDLFPANPANVRLNNLSTFELHQRMLDMILDLNPANPRDQWRREQALTLVARIGDTRWLLAEEGGHGTPMTFVALLVFWLALLFASFGLFAPHNPTAVVILTLCALAVAAAVGMFLELEQGFGGLVRVSPQPMRQAVQILQAHLERSGVGP